MKKVFKTILIIVLVLVIVGVGGCAVIMYKSNDQKVNYYKYATPVGEIETKYTALGTYKVSTAEYDSGNETYGKYLIWYPSEMKDGNATYPIVIIANGTGSKASTYKEIYNHLASWGFIVVGNEDEDSRTGASSAATLDFILKLNQDANSDFLLAPGENNHSGGQAKITNFSQAKITNPLFLKLLYTESVANPR